MRRDTVRRSTERSAPVGGLGAGKILQVTVHVATELDQQTVSAAVDAVFGDDRPACTVAGVDRLPEGAAVQADAVAVKQ